MGLGHCGQSQFGTGIRRSGGDSLSIPKWVFVELRILDRDFGPVGCFYCKRVESREEGWRGHVHLMTRKASRPREGAFRLGERCRHR